MNRAIKLTLLPGLKRTKNAIEELNSKREKFHFRVHSVPTTSWIAEFAHFHKQKKLKVFILLIKMQCCVDNTRSFS